MLIAAIALWGWSGMHVEVSVVSIGWGVAAQSYPTADFTSCRVEVDDELMARHARGEVVNRSLGRVLLHEAGHCVGYWPEVAGGSAHSLDPASIMYSPANGDTGEILRADRERIKRIRDIKLPYRTVVGGVSK